MNPHAINIFTDGSAIPNPGESGEGIVIVYPDGTVQEVVPDGYKVSTNNRTELRACIDALKYLQKDPKSQGTNHVCMHSDSQYVVDGFSVMRSGYRQRTGWRTTDDNEVDNKSLWKDLERECRKIGKRVEIFKVKAHSGVEHNENADKLADKSRENPIKDDYYSKRKQLRRWLKIPNKDIADGGLPKNIIVFVQRTDRRDKLYEMYVQVLRPIKYIGYRIKIRASVETQPVKGAHIYQLRIKYEKKVYVLENIVRDLGKSSGNRTLYERYLRKT